MRDLAVLFLHVLTTIARLAGPGGARAVVAESVLVKHQLLILNRSRKRSPNLRSADRVVAGLCAVFIRPGRLVRSAIVFKPTTLFNLHRALIQRKYRRPEPESGRRSGESSGLPLAATLSWAVSHAEGRVTPSICSAFTGAICEFAIHRLSVFGFDRGRKTLVHGDLPVFVCRLYLEVIGTRFLADVRDITTRALAVHDHLDQTTADRAS